MSRPDITGLERDKAWAVIQGNLKAEQNQLKPGHGIWYDFNNYPLLKKTYISRPVFYKVVAALGWIAAKPPEFDHLPVTMARTFHKRGFLSVRVTGPIVNSPQYRHGLELIEQRKIQRERDLEAEWVITHRQPGWRTFQWQRNKDLPTVDELLD